MLCSCPSLTSTFLETGHRITRRYWNCGNQAETRQVQHPDPAAHPFQEHNQGKLKGHRHRGSVSWTSKSIDSLIPHLGIQRVYSSNKRRSNYRDWDLRLINLVTSNHPRLSAWDGSVVERAASIQALIARGSSSMNVGLGATKRSL